jgi:hypothetical protein
MAKKRKSASARLLELKESSRQNPFRIASDWNDPGVRARAALVALDLDSDSSDANKSIRKAFEEFQLDWRNPHHWRQLLEYYVRANVPPGRPTQWTSEDLCALLRHISDTRKKDPHLKRRSEIYSALVKRSAPYAGKKEDHLKYAHKRALDPKHNEILRMHRDASIQEARTVIRWSYEKMGKGEVPPAVGEKIRETALDAALEKIGAPLGNK